MNNHLTTAEIITIGEELLIGQVVDTNSAWLAQQLNQVGISVNQITSISDNEQQIIKTLDDARIRAHIILITGGLGPTKDDITKYALCKYFKSNLRFDEQTFLNVERLFKARGKTVSALNRKQAEVPEKCEVIENALGTAPGMWFEEKERVYVSMPGVPYEMKEMAEKYILPKLKEKFVKGFIIHKTILTQGIPESYLSEIIASWEDNLPANITLAYLPSPGLVRLRITAIGTNEQELKRQLKEETLKLSALAGEYIYGYDEDTLEKIVGKLLIQRKATLSTAESCTGGYIAHRITTVPGSSAYFSGSLVSYSNHIKENILHVPKEILQTNGAVSEETVKAMAANIKEKFRTHYAIAVSGIAGPTGGTPEKPVGTVWLAIHYPGGIFTKKLQLGNHRQRNIIETSLHALNELRKLLLKNP